MIGLPEICPEHPLQAQLACTLARMYARHPWPAFHRRAPCVPSDGGQGFSPDGPDHHS